MDSSKLLEERLREACCFGDEDAVKKLVERNVNVNAQHEMNNWTALHWASKRGHKSIVAYLLSHGADKNLTSAIGETAVMLTDNEEIKKILGGSSSGETTHSSPPLPITPNYLAHPPLNYKVDVRDNMFYDSGKNEQNVTVNTTDGKYEVNSATNDYELVLKVRLANSQDPDFIEIEIPQDQLTYGYLLHVCCEELNIEKEQVARIRKLPNTVLRKDKDIQRLHNFQELEVVLDLTCQVKSDDLCTSENHNSLPNETFLKNSSAPPPPGYLTISNSPSVTKNLFEKSTFCKNGTILY